MTRNFRAGKPASASLVSTSPTGWISTATPSWAATSGSSSCNKQHLKQEVQALGTHLAEGSWLALRLANRCT